MKTIEKGFYSRYLSKDRYLTLEVVEKTVDENQPWALDERLTTIHMYKRKAGTVKFRILANAPIEADLYQVRYDELPEEESYEYFTAGMSDIHPNDRIK